MSEFISAYLLLISHVILILSLVLSHQGRGNMGRGFHNSPACQRICSAGKPGPSYLKRGFGGRQLEKGNRQHRGFLLKHPP